MFKYLSLAALALLTSCVITGRHTGTTGVGSPAPAQGATAQSAQSSPVRPLSGARLYRIDAQQSPVAAFVVDDTAARAQEGAPFVGEVTDEARAGTLHNMLGTALLDADEFPSVKVDSVAIAVGKSGGGALQVPDSVRVKFTLVAVVS